MKVKQLVKCVILGIVSILSKVSMGRYINQVIIDTAMNHKGVVNYHSHKLFFAVPNELSRYRLDTFVSKEPETLEWIESIPMDSILWDVGANIGLYAIYAAKGRNCRVYAFEPSVFNLELLARNIFLNALQKQITIVPIALSDKVGTSLFKMSTTAWGGALSTFGQNFDQNGSILKNIFEYQIPGLTMDDTANLLGIPIPQFIKIDVDGIEHYILRGGVDVLSNVESVLIEINDEFPEQSEETTKYLKNAGLSLYRKCDLGVPNQYNQWWVRELPTVDNT